MPGVQRIRNLGVYDVFACNLAGEHPIVEASEQSIAQSSRFMLMSLLFASSYVMYMNILSILLAPESIADETPRIPCCEGRTWATQVCAGTTPWVATFF